MRPLLIVFSFSLFSLSHFYFSSPFFFAILLHLENLLGTGFNLYQVQKRLVFETLVHEYVQYVFDLFTLAGTDESIGQRGRRHLEVDIRAAGWAGKFRVLSGGRQPRLHSIQIKGQEPRVHRMRILLRELFWALKGNR